jgi:hypothetical protein
VGSKVQSREISFRDGAVLVPLVLVILFLALYPQLALHRSEASVKQAVAPAEVVGGYTVTTFSARLAPGQQGSIGTGEAQPPGPVHESGSGTHPTPVETE